MTDYLDHTAIKQGERWMGALFKRWEPNGRCPQTPGEAAALGLEHGLSDWAPGPRLYLVYIAVERSAPNADAFTTLACRDWPVDWLTDQNPWLLPMQLAWAYADVDLRDDTGLPNGVKPEDLPHLKQRS